MVARAEMNVLAGVERRRWGLVLGPCSSRLGERVRELGPRPSRVEWFAVLSEYAPTLCFIPRTASISGANA